MRLSFDTIDEVKDFVKQLKGTRGGKVGDNDEGAAAGNAPQPLAPPLGQATTFNPAGGPGFAPPAGGAIQTGAGPFAAGATVLAPEIQALVTRIVTRIDGAAASGQSVDAMLTWLRGNVGDPGAASATLDQIKTVFLPRASAPTLENIAKLMAA